MVKKLGAVTLGVAIGLAIAFARAGAFPFWGSDSDSPSPQAQSSPATQSAQANTASAPPMAPALAPPNQPEPGERTGGPSTFAPLVKRVMPTVVNVAVVQDVK